MRLLPAALLLVLAGCHGASGSDGASADEARELNEAAASIDINATSADQGGDQNGDQAP